MDYGIKTGNPEQQRSACLIVGVHPKHKLSHAAQRIDKASGGRIKRVLKHDDLSGKVGQTLLLHGLEGCVAERVLLVGCGEHDELDAGGFRKLVTQAIKAVSATGAANALLCLAELPVKDRDLYWKLRQCVELAAHTTYRFTRLKSKRDEPVRLKRIDLLVGENGAEAKRALAHGKAIAAGVALARDLGNLPGNVCTPSYLASQARAIGKGQKALKVGVLERKDMEKLGMGALLSVARGSTQPPKLITLDYRGGKRGQQPVVLVGKGVTFDSGGISIKPAATMDEMKFDMCGAASVLGALRACVDMQLPLNVVGVIPATENLPDGSASKPGDIVTSLSGQTIEVLNTDAEGRLILCDALTYSAKYKPDVVIDIATLTGACVIALGRHPSGLLGNHAPLIEDLKQAGNASCDRVWEMPLWDEYQDQLKSNFADIANIGGRDGGTITAACFLSRFTKEYRWAHLDIAGTAWKSGDSKGATGRPVNLLVQYLINKAKA